MAVRVTHLMQSQYGAEKEFDHFLRKENANAP